MQTKQKLISVAALIACSGICTQTHAALPSNATLQFIPAVRGGPYNFIQSGSYFGMDSNSNVDISPDERTGILENNGLVIGTIQLASGNHGGAPNGTESPDIDQPWSFFGNTGLHWTISAPTILTDDGSGNVTIDLSGWGVAWNTADSIPMSGGAWEAGFTDGVAKIVCGTDCSNGDTYILDYSATVPNPCGGCNFENVKYHLHLEGTVFVPNTPPTAIADTILVNEGESATIDVTTNGSGDVEDGPTVLKIGTFPSPPSNGTATGEGTDTITYTNTNTAASTDSFTYTVNDSQAEFNISDPATVTVTINHFPVAISDTVPAEPNDTVEIIVLDFVTDTDVSDTIDATSVTTVPDTSSGATGITTNGTITTNATTGRVTYVNNGTTGLDSFTYTAADNNGAISNSETIFINVEIDPAPTCSDTTLILDQDTSATFAVGDFATAGGSKTLDFATIVTTPFPSTPNGSLAINTTTGVITYTPDAGYFGQDDPFTYTVNDNTKTCLPGTVNITVNSTNTAPVVVDDNDIGITTTTVNTALNIDVKANDTDDDDLANSSVTITNPPVNGSANVETDGTVTYTPATGYSGSESFTYNLTDAGSLPSLNATVSVTVVANDPSASSGTLAPGDTAITAGSTDGRVTAAEIGIPDNGSSEEQGISQSCIGSCFDFKVTGFSGDVQVVLPLSEAIPTPAAGSSLLYRKLTATGWVNFDTSGNNAIHTAPGVGSGASTVCPAAGDASYGTSPGLTTGDRCIRLTIVDNGPNDNDATVGTVADPSGIAESFSIDTRVSSTDGCSMSGNSVNSNQRADWWLVAGFMGLLGLFRLKRNKA